MAKPSKHIESGTTGVTRKGAPREPVKKLANPDELTPLEVDDIDGLDDDDLILDDATDTADTDADTEAADGDADAEVAVGDPGAGDAAGETSGTKARKRKTPGAKGDDKADKAGKTEKATATGKGGVRKVDRSSGRANAKATSKHSSKRVTAKGTPPASTRYTPPAARYEDMPSPMWVPILMFTLFVLGMLTIFLNYVALLPGATSNWYLLAGLGFILARIITATQYR